MSKDRGRKAVKKPKQVKSKTKQVVYLSVQGTKNPNTEAGPIDRAAKNQ